MWNMSGNMQKFSSMKGFGIFRIIILSLGVIIMLYYAVLWLIRFFSGEPSGDAMVIDVVAFTTAMILVVWMLYAGRKGK